MDILSYEEARREIARLRAQAERYRQPDGFNEVGDHDEDYLIDALFDIPNR